MSIDFSWWQKPPPIVDSTEDVLRQYILEPVIPVNEPKPHFQPRVPTVESLYDIPPAPLSTRIVPERCQETGKIIDFIEIPIENAGSTAKNSMSLKREPGPGDDSTRGSTLSINWQYSASSLRHFSLFVTQRATRSKKKKIP